MAKRPASMSPTQRTLALLREVFTYRAGKLFWRKRPLSHFANQHHCNVWNAIYPRREAGCLTTTASGYRKWVIRFDRILYRRSSLVWAIHFGKWPVSQLDHKNRDSIDDRLRNLRQATPTQNAGNSKMRCTNTSGITGVTWIPRLNKWCARLTVNGSNTYLGVFSSATAAKRAYAKAAKQHFGEFANLGG